MKNLDNLKEILASPKKIVIVTHRNPDGDAIGSSLGLYHYLKKKNHDAHIITPSDYPDNFEWMPGVETIKVDDNIDDKPLATQLCKEADLFFCLDFNSLSRIDRVGALIAESDKPKVMIDHHLEPDDFAEFMYSDPSASSTCEMLYHFIQMMGDKDMVDNTIGTAIFTGILTDTGSFGYATSPKLFRTVADLQESGVDLTFLQNKLFNNQTNKQFRLLGFCLTDAMFLYPRFRTGIIVLSLHDHKRFKIKRGDTEGVVNYLLKMRDIRMAILISEREKQVKLSFRSKGSFSVQEIAQKYFKGGGHRNAAGGISEETLGDTRRILEELLEIYEEPLSAEPDF